MAYGIEFGGPNARETGYFRSLVYALQYVNEEPSLVLAKASAVRNHPMLVQNFPAAVIGLSRAWRYRGDNDEAIAIAFPHWVRLTEAIGLDPNSRADLRMVADACEHLLERLQKMKPLPQDMARKPVEVADVYVNSDGGLKVTLH